MIRAGIELCAQGVEHPLPGVGALDHRIDQGRLELRLREYTGGIQLFQPTLDLFEPLRARAHRGVDGDGADGVHAVPVLEILIGIVEHDVRTIGNGREPALQGPIELVEPLTQARGIDLIG